MRCLRLPSFSMLINLYLKSLIQSCYVFISHILCKNYEKLLKFVFDPATQRGHKTINENKKANLDNENIFTFISVLISPKNLKDQKILIDIFNSPVGSIMSRLRRASEREREFCECGREVETIGRIIVVERRKHASYKLIVSAYPMRLI